MSKPLTQEENDLLCPKVIAGDKDARDALIVGNMSLVITKVNTFIQGHPSAAHLRDDLTSAGFVGLTKAVDELTSEIKNPMGYIATSIYNHLGFLLESEMSIRIPHESKRLSRNTDKPIKECEIYSIQDDSLLSASETDFDMRDLIDTCYESDKEQEFVRLREAGYTLAEISEKLDIGLNKLFYLSSKLYERVKQKLQEQRY
jgi:RNA polymerase sigma factor (sigma-70 family)